MFRNKPSNYRRIKTAILPLLLSLGLASRAQDLKITPGTYKASWSSLESYKQAPDWFRDAKFGIWAHWGPQCEPEAGDWYARNMYIQGSRQYQLHVKRYGHPSKFGFKDVIHLWKAEHFDPEQLMALYKNAGAKYFVALAAHHDNFDLWDSKYQPWNAVNMGPQKNLVSKWADAAKKAGLRFGVSIHARSAWSWYEVAQLSDTTGAMAGVPYDGKLTRADGKGLWWEGYDPQDLYEQRHTPSIYARDRKLQSKFPGEPASTAYNMKFYNRVLDVVDKYEPDLVYFDDYKLPLGVKDDREKYSLNLVANIYNRNAARHSGKNEAVINTKSLTGSEQKCLVNDLEVGTERSINPIPWQSDACIGNWHYQKDVHYKDAKSVIHALADVVSKNGNLLLSVPIKADGTLDDQEKKILKEIGEWMAVNGNAIYGTRPWTRYGEGPSLEKYIPDNGKGAMPLFRKKSDAYTEADIRFTQKEGSLFAICMEWPASGKVCITSLKGISKEQLDAIKATMLGYNGPLELNSTSKGLEIALPSAPPNPIAYVIRLDGLTK
ncbi:alpha-L-fucosidase [Mucilaginibacter sp. RS28]|uniref:alpha-L-fucosidase n=1 Tax=Mucilaginibacter straminoryzae TaxID=2932774 RepID=A0A9X2B7V8_9SPHI|nr:alpha-L-fucosidase [Mucilaginibacter straminoryzae]MCJ8209009.1 alpha-L-fucosidase [Mucilaginibacter straminoryzae]